MPRPHFQCVDCAATMVIVSTDTLCCSNCDKKYIRTRGVYEAYPEYHDHFDEDAVVVHQLNAWRNLYYHQYIWNILQTLPTQSGLLEIGAGSGFDAKQLFSYQLTLTDISADTLRRLQKKQERKDPLYVACDGAVLPFVKDSFTGVYTVATWHHFANPGEALQEMARVLAPGGRLVIGVEPNKVYFRLIKKFRSVLCKFTGMHEHDGSHADAEMEGFSYSQLKTLFSLDQWTEVQIRPMWFLAGFLHYGLEFLFRVFKLKQRIKFPTFLEKITVAIDELIFKIPLLNRLGWHWIVVAKKK